MSLKSILMNIFPFLFSAVAKFYEDLPEPTKEALLSAGQFGQLLKEGYAKGYDAFVRVVADKLGMTQEQTDALLLALAKKMNIDIHAPNELFDQLQAIVDKGLEDSAWDNLWHSVSGQLAIILSGGRFNWAQLAMGIIQFVYEKFVK